MSQSRFVSITFAVVCIIGLANAGDARADGELEINNFTPLPNIPIRTATPLNVSAMIVGCTPNTPVSVSVVILNKATGVNVIKTATVVADQFGNAQFGQNILPPPGTKGDPASVTLEAIQGKTKEGKATSQLTYQ